MPTRFPFAHARTDSPADFSFSGIKTALLRAVTPYRLPDEPAPERRARYAVRHASPDPPAGRRAGRDLAAAYQDAIVAMLIAPVARAAREHRAASVLLAGGVAANRLLRERLAAAVDVPLFCPPPIYCTDNAAMIGAAAERRMRAGEFAGWDLDVQPSLRLV